MDPQLLCQCASRTVLPQRRLPVGAEPQPAGGAHFRVWAPERQKVEVVLEGTRGAASTIELARELGGYFGVLASDAQVGQLYRFRLDADDQQLFPDPASRFQPEGPFGPSQVVDPGQFRWSDAAWAGVNLAGQILYELHVGTFTREGTWEAAARELPELVETG